MKKEPEAAAVSEEPAAGSAEEAGTLDALDAMIAAAAGNGGADTERTPKAAADPVESLESEVLQEEPAGDTPAFASQAEPAAQDAQEFDLVRLWDEVFADGEHQKGSIYLIRSNGMLTDMDENTFTVTVGSDLHRRQTERNRDLLEDLMEARTGQRRRMQVVTGEMTEPAEISVEEAAARASEVLGTKVTIK